MPWTYVQIEVTSQGLFPQFGPGQMTRERAKEEVQNGLDLIARVHPAVQKAAERWRAGVKDDTLRLGPIDGTMFVWTLVEHPDGEDPTYAVRSWVESFAQQIPGNLPVTWTP